MSHPLRRRPGHAPGPLPVLTLALLAIACPATPALAQATRPAAADADAERERRFAELLTGATLVGSFTTSRDKAPPRPERYAISSARKLFGDRWLITARIQYGGKDQTVPVPVPVHVFWADDTPVISLTDLSIPGMGTYSARVLFHGDMYAGTWSAPNESGHLFGRIERPRPATRPAER